MLKLIPNVKSLKELPGTVLKKAIYYNSLSVDERLQNALKKLPFAQDGLALSIEILEKDTEKYSLFLDENKIEIKAESTVAAFDAIQTLRQIFTHESIPCLQIEDWPDFKYRGFYHDVTRGKIPTVETVKKLVDQMVYYKLNALQLYVEHTFDFKEYAEVTRKFGCLTAADIKEIAAYCKQNFVDFTPSLSTFGHLYELLELEQYKHLRVLKDYQSKNFWESRMSHHTVDPLHPESLPLIKSLIEQYIPNFESEYFNICCDETFDLKLYAEQGIDVGKMYVDFVKQIIEIVKQNNKKVMMWADILLQHPDAIDALPEDICLLNWDYWTGVKEDKIKVIADTGRRQIVCPGTGSWSRLCENITVEEINISKMTEYGYKFGAEGVLNTNWGDWGNPCCLELAMYGLVLGAEKSWSVKTEIDEAFYSRVDFLLYRHEGGIQCLKALNDMQNMVYWGNFAANYFAMKNGDTAPENIKNVLTVEPETVQKAFEEFKALVGSAPWEQEEYRSEMLLAAEGSCVMAELGSKLANKPLNRVTDTETWLKKYREKWLQKNKQSELQSIEEMFLYYEKNV